jgi:hypothetical protein
MIRCSDRAARDLHCPYVKSSLISWNLPMEVHVSLALGQQGTEYQFVQSKRRLTPLFTPTHPDIIRLRPTRFDLDPSEIRVPKALSDMVRHPDSH